MTQDKLRAEYFDWMCQLISDRKKSRSLSYRKLLKHLHDLEFTYTIGLDGNRSEDGIDLRYRFGYDCEYDNAMIASLLDDQPCSILEMLIALSIRCEEHIMGDPDIGNRTSTWFWNMINNMGLGSMRDAKFDICRVNSIISRFLDHEYGRDGDGGLFTIKNCKRDLRSVEIWYQMCWYLDSILKK